MALSKQDVTAGVLHILASLTGIDDARLAAKYMSVALADPPLSLDDDGLRHLAMSLRGYVMHQNPKVSILIGDVSKSGETVGDLCTLVYQRITQ